MTTPRYHDGLRLVATRSAISCSRIFVAITLDKWGASVILQDAMSVADDLVTNAVHATGIPQERIHWTELTRIEYITVRLLGLETSIRIEVWDSAPDPPLLPNDASSPVKRGYHPTTRGKVVWAELPVLPHHRKPSLPPQPPAEQFARDPDLLRRVWEGLDSL